VPPQSVRTSRLSQTTSSMCSSTPALYLENIVRFNELIRLLDKEGFKIVKEKGSIDIMEKLDGINWFVLIIMGQKKFRKELVMLY